MMSVGKTIITPAVDAGQVLASADETKRSLRQRISAILDIGAKDAAAAAAHAAVTIFRELDPETLRRATLSFLVGLAADDARFRKGACIDGPMKRTKSDAPAGVRKNLTKPMPRGTKYAGESFSISCPEARYAEIMAKQRAEQAKRDASDA